MPGTNEKRLFRVRYEGEFFLLAKAGAGDPVQDALVQLRQSIRDGVEMTIEEMTAQDLPRLRPDEAESIPWGSDDRSTTVGAIVTGLAAPPAARRQGKLPIGRSGRAGHP